MDDYQWLYSTPELAAAAAAERDTSCLVTAYAQYGTVSQTFTAVQTKDPTRYTKLTLSVSDCVLHCLNTPSWRLPGRP